MMADLYNLTALKNAETIVDVIIAANNAYPNNAQGPQLLVGGFLVALFVVLLMMMKKANFTDRLLVASWLCFVLSLFLRVAELINFYFVIGFSLMAALTMLYSVTIGNSK